MQQVSKFPTEQSHNSSFTQKKAASYGLTGWVKNTPNDKVSLPVIQTSPLRAETV